MNALVESGRLLDIVIAFTLLEIAALWLFHRRTGRGLSLRRFLPNLMAGLFLMLAVRSAMVQADWIWIVLPLLASAVSHALDLRQRWPRQDNPSS